MAEVTPDVFDIFHPTPISLKDLAAISASLGVWRCEINKHRQTCTLAGFHPPAKYCSLITLLPDLPYAIYETIKEYFLMFGNSLGNWLSDHYKKVHFCYFRKNDVLIDFDDFVCDYYGRIDYVRTAKRMMRCNKFSLDDKFNIACAYFFEDDIARLWPLASKEMRIHRRKLRPLASRSTNTYLDRIDFRERPHLYYWICCLTNQLEKIPTRGNNTIDDEMLSLHIPRIGPTMVYFWNRMPLEKRTNVDLLFDLMKDDAECFARFIVPKLNGQQIAEFVADDGGVGGFWIHRMCEKVADHGEKLVLNTWLYIRNVMSEGAFTNLILRMLGVDDDHTEDDDLVSRDYLFQEIWESAPSDLKRSVIGNISPDALEDIGINGDYYHSIEIELEFLLTVVEYAPSEDRNSFWHDCWHLLMAAIPVESLQQVMELCFENEDEILHFKLNVMTENHLVRELCITFVMNSSFKSLNEFVSFCCPEAQAASIFKQQLLQSAFLDDDSILCCEIVSHYKKLNKFIDDAYNDVDLATEFKNQLISSPLNQLRLCELACSGSISLNRLIEFIDTFVPTQQNVLQIKLRMVDLLKEDYRRNPGRYSSTEYSCSVWEVMEVLLPFIDTNKRKSA